MNLFDITHYEIACDLGFIATKRY